MFMHWSQKKMTQPAGVTMVWHFEYGNLLVYHVVTSAAEIRSPGRQMLSMNPPGDPRSYYRLSVWRPMDSLGFAENVLEWKWTDDSTDALTLNVYCALVKCRPCLVHFWAFFDWLHGLSRILIGGLPRTETDHPNINHGILHFLQHCVTYWVWQSVGLSCLLCPICQVYLR